MEDFKTLYKTDMKRYNGNCTWFLRRWHYYFRKTQTSNGLIKKLFRMIYISISARHAIEIGDEARVGKGLYIGHPYGITINGATIIGENCNIHKGVLIGRENRGKRIGAPIIGNRCWIGINAIIVGNITIGDDVMIAPGSFVNRDIPSHSVVFGNPCQFIYRENATEKYI